MKRIPFLWLIFIVLLIPAAALSATAQDITSDCSIVPSLATGRAGWMLDDDYSTSWFVSQPAGVSIEIAAPEHQTIGGVYLKWNLRASRFIVDVLSEGTWQTIEQVNGGYAVQFITLPPDTDRFRIRRAEDDQTEFRVVELRVYGPGELPNDVQAWQPEFDTCDLLVISTHPDDEYLYLGGTIPYYVAQGKAVQVLYVAPSSSIRYLELLDGLWLCGVRNYPVLGTFTDKKYDRVEEIYQCWSRDKLQRFLLSNIRKFKPDVVVTQDLKGEYGHVAHIATSANTAWAVNNAGDAAIDPESAEQYGVWQVKKTYLHLYPENTIVMDWSTPLPYFGGESALSMAEQAFALHRSQQLLNYRVRAEGDYDCRLFGLYASTVGEDILKTDFFENIP